MKKNSILEVVTKSKTIVTTNIILIKVVVTTMTSQGRISIIMNMIRRY